MADRIKKAFDYIHAEEKLKENTRACLQQKCCESHKKITLYSRYAISFCLVFLICTAGCSLFFIPVTYISVDINPSIELELNRFDRIIEIIPYNQDGAELVKNISLKYKKYDEAILTFLESSEVEPYLSEDAQISISVASEYEDKNTEIQSRVIERTRHNYGNVSCHSSSEEDMKNAHHAGMSFGKYRAFLELQELNPELTVEDVRDMSMCQIRDSIEHYSCDAEENESHCKDRCRHGKR